MTSKAKRDATTGVSTDNKVFLFIIESPNPIDLLIKDRTEGRLLAAVAELVGHRAHYFLVKNEEQLREVCKYIATIDTGQEEEEERRAPLCIHISAHGNSEGLGIDGPKSVKGTMPWSILLDCLSPIFGEVEHLGKRLLVLSSCGANEQTLTQEARKRAYKNRPHYVFTTVGKPPWPNAAMQWAVFYNRLPDIDLSKESTKDLLDQITSLKLGRLQYHRWIDGEKRYRKHIGKARRLR